MMAPEAADTDGSAESKSRLLILTSTYPRWKSDHEPGFVHELARRLTDRFEVHVLGPHAPGAARSEVLDGVNVHRFRYAPVRMETLVNDGGIVTNLKRQHWKWLLVPGFFIAMAISTWRKLRHVRPNIVHAHWLILQGLVMALLSLVSRTPPFLVTSHGADLFTLRSPPMIALKRFTVRRAAALTVVSQAMVEELQRIGVEGGKISVQPMGVDLQSRFTPDDSVKRSDDEILFVGRLVEKKGLRYLIAAMPEILKHHPEASLTIAGYGPEEDRLWKQVTDLGVENQVHFLGAIPQDRLPDLYRRATIFVAPFVEASSGDQEGLGLVTIEAMGCGCPAITSELAATRELPTIKVPPAHDNALARAIYEFLSMYRQERKAVARRQQSEIAQLDWTEVSEGYRTRLEDLRHAGIKSVIGSDTSQ